MARVLLVEDNEMNSDLLIRRLTRRGYELCLAVDGQQAVDMASEEKPDIILMDMGLPVMDGWEATRLIKSLDHTRSIPIIGLSAHAMETDRDKALDAGCDDYDTKPVDINRLLDKMKALIP